MFRLVFNLLEKIKISIYNKIYLIIIKEGKVSKENSKKNERKSKQSVLMG
jgi:hypothetical protein